MKSISQSQAEALANGFLSTQGANKGEFKPVRLLSQVMLIAGSVVKEAQVNLNKNNSNSSGMLSDSLEITEPTQQGSVFKCDVRMQYYGKFVNKGVKGLEKGSSNAGYAFKNLFVSKDFISSLQHSRKRSSAKITSTNVNKTVSQNEKKNATVSEVASAWGAAINIKKFGITPTGFIDKAVDTISNKVEAQLGIALKIDIENSLSNDN